jgi:hypothetical protein
VSGGIAIFVCFTMSSRFSARDYDDRPLSSPRSLVDLSPSSHSHSPRSRVRSGSLGAETEAPTISTQTERSNIRINTDLTVSVNIFFTRQKIYIPYRLDRCRRLGLDFGPSFFSLHAENRLCLRQRQPRPTRGVRHSMCDRLTHVLLPSRLP